MVNNRPAAAFSTEDFQLLHNALSHYIMSGRHGDHVLDENEHRKCSQLLHRLTRIQGVGFKSLDAQ